jgi:hypothetical protein
VYADIPAPARQAALKFSLTPGVIAIAMGGSRSASQNDEASDVDLYVYARGEIPLAVRQAIVGDSPRVDLDNHFWEPGDEWIDRATGLGVDVMYRSPEWIEGELDRVLRRHEASLGYTTCLWHNVRTALPLFDPEDWLAHLQALTSVPYPEGLRHAIIAKNYPILRDTLSSYRHQLELAARRGDLVSLNHRTAAFLASYFDILFAVNRVPHPGEKRLVAMTRSLCPLCPPNLEADISRLIRAIAAENDPGSVASAIDVLVDGLDQVLDGK